MDHLKKSPDNKHLIITGNRDKVTVVARDSIMPIKNDGLLTNPKEGDITKSFTRAEVEQSIVEGKMPQELGVTLIEFLDDQQSSMDLANKISNTKNMTEKEAYERHLQELLENYTNQSSALRRFLTIENDFFMSKIPDTSYKNIGNEYFLVAKTLADRLGYIPKLLDKSELFPSHQEGQYMIRSSMKLSNSSEIGLSYSFTQPADKKLEDIFKKYCNDMEGALKVLLSYWACATEMGYFQYLAPITTIMSFAKHDDRKHSWSSSEKKRFWELSKLLENTYLTFTCKIDKEWIDIKTPLLDLSITANSSKDQETKNGYPDKVVPCVLNGPLQKVAYLVTEISKGTLSLRHEDILLALYPQVRAKQKGNANYTNIDEVYAMELAGLSKTYKSNPRMARKKLKEKLSKSQKAGAISGWEKDKDESLKLLYKRPQKNKPIK